MPVARFNGLLTVRSCRKLPFANSGRHKTCMCVCGCSYLKTFYTHPLDTFYPAAYSSPTAELIVQNYERSITFYRVFCRFTHFSSAFAPNDRQWFHFCFWCVLISIYILHTHTHAHTQRISTFHTHCAQQPWSGLWLL